MRTGGMRVGNRCYIQAGTDLAELARCAPVMLRGSSDLPVKEKRAFGQMFPIGTPLFFFSSSFGRCIIVVCIMFTSLF